MNLNNKFIYVLVFLVSCFFNTVYSQKEDHIDDVEEILSLSDTDNEVEVRTEDLIQTLEELSENPVDINTASRQQLEKIYLLNEFQILSLLDYRKNFGNFTSIYELPFVYGFNENDARKIAPYITISKQLSGKIASKPKYLIINKFIYRNDQKSIDNNYPMKIYNRCQVEFRNIKTGFTTENDPNEDLFKNSNQKGFDFYSGYIWYKPNNKFVSDIFIGDYAATFGQGLNISGGFARSKNVTNQFFRKTSLGIKPYTSVDENSFLRGGAVTFKFQNLSFYVVYSNKKIDANVKSDSTDTFFSGYQNSGIHISESEINNENSIREELRGVNLKYSNNWITGGFTLSNIRYSNRFINKSYDKKFLPSGDIFRTISTDWTIFYKNILLYSEWSVCENRQKAWLAGMNLNMIYNNYLSVFIRNYDRGYFSVYGNAFSENSETRNEKGVFLGIQNKTIRYLTLSGYADFYKFPWFRYQGNTLKSGCEYAFFTECIINENLFLSLKIRMENQDNDYTYDLEEINKDLDYNQKKSYRFQIQYNLTDALTFKNRIETSQSITNNIHNKGFLVYHDIKYKILKGDITIYTRYIIFDCIDFNSRIYQYENDLRYSFNIPFFYGKGYKWYLMLKYNLKNIVDIYVKTEKTNYLDKKNFWVLKGQLVWCFK